MKIIVALSAVLLACTACGTNAGGTAGTPQMETPLASADIGSIRNPSGDYSGTIDDSLHGKGTVNAAFAQYQGSLGGTLTSAIGSSSTTALTAWSIDGTTIQGDAVESTSSGLCTFAETATYERRGHRLIGSYHAVHGCSGERGRFRMKQECFFRRAQDDDVRIDAGGLRPC